MRSHNSSIRLELSGEEFERLRRVAYAWHQTRTLSADRIEQVAEVLLLKGLLAAEAERQLSMLDDAQ